MRRAIALVVVSACSGAPTGVGLEPDAAPVAGADAEAAAPHGPYPIVLAHGLFGFKNIGPLDYFYGIRPALEATGRTVVATQVDGIQTSEVRGAQLVAAIEDVRATTGAAKVIVIGHSQGGLDARWAAAHDPASIAAVITVATPHRGSPVADVASGVLPGDSSAALSVLADLFGLAPGSSSSFPGAIELLTTDGAAAFNAANPDVPGLPYWSVAGRSNLVAADGCPASSDVTAAWDGSRDPMKLELSPVAGILALAALPATPVNDGLVTVDSATWGTFLGCVPADHFDEVCQIAGQSAGLGNDYDCVQMYLNLEKRLRATGL